MSTFADYLRRHLVGSGLRTQLALAKAIEMDYGQLNKIFTGKTQRPEIETLEKIATVIRRPIAEVMIAAGYPTPKNATAYAGVAEPREIRSFDDVAHLLKEYADRQVEARVSVASAHVVSIPIVNALSAHDAGNLDRQVNDTIEVPAWLVEGVGDPVLFVVSGDCLGADNLATGDLVLIDRSITEPYEGEIVAARANGEETLKHWHHLGDRVELRPSSPGFPTIVVREGEVTVIGVFAGVLRRGGRRGR